MGKKNLKNKDKAPKEKEKKENENSNIHSIHKRLIGEITNEKNNGHLFVKKKKLIPLEKLKLDKAYKESDIQNMSIDELKKLASKFDLNPKINFRLLYLLKKENGKYDKYIKKYKYTLDYKDAKELECFNSEFVIKMNQLYKDNLIKSNIDYFFNNLASYKPNY